LQDEGQSSPLDNLPSLTLDENIYYSDFNALCSERSGGMGISSIPITRINQYARQHGVHNIYLFEQVIMQIDNAYMKFVSEKQERQSKKGKK